MHLEIIGIGILMGIAFAAPGGAVTAETFRRGALGVRARDHHRANAQADASRRFQIVSIVCGLALGAFGLITARQVLFSIIN